MITIIHFSQDFEKSKPQLGGFSRIYNICCDGNKHIIFTIDKDSDEIATWMLRHNITVVAIPLHGKAFSRIQQVKYHKIIVVQITKWLKENKVKPDLLFGHSQLVNYFILSSVRRDFVQLKLIWELNAIWGIHSAKGVVQKLFNRMVVLLQKKVLHRANYIIAQTEASKQYVVKHFAAKPDKISVIRNAIQADDANPLPSYKMAKPFRILCFGLFDKMNGIPFLLDSVTGKLDGYEIDFYGNGAYINQVKAKSHLGLINYQGTLPREEMMLQLKTYDFVIIPRLPEIEADLYIPTKLIECMANGVIPICSDVNGMTEVVEDGVNGFVFKAGCKKALHELLLRISSLAPEELLNIKQEAIATVRQKYMWDEKHIELNTIYKLLLNQS